MSRARLFRSIKALDADAVAELLAAQPELARATDDRRRNPLHFLCSLPASPKTSDRSIRLARQLLAAGIGIDAPAFVEGAFQATPLWYAISRGQNSPLARFLLKQGSTPEYCLWAAGFKDDAEQGRQDPARPRREAPRQDLPQAPHPLTPRRAIRDKTPPSAPR